MNSSQQYRLPNSSPLQNLTVSNVPRVDFLGTARRADCVIYLAQSDEQDMGLSYNELTVLGRYVILHLLPSCFGVFRGAVARKENAD